MSPEQLFPEQRADEEVQVIVRPHWLVLLPQILLAVILIIVPVAILIPVTASAEPISTTTRNVLVVVVPLYYLFLVTAAYIRWLDYYLDVGIVTDQRVVDIDQRGMFRRNVAELELDVVQDVSEERTGMLQTIFNFGNVVIQTAGEQANFQFVGIPEPTEIAKQIGQAAKASKEETPEADKLDSTAEKMGEVVEKISDISDQAEPAPPPKPSSKAGNDAPVVTVTHTPGSAPTQSSTTPTTDHPDPTGNKSAESEADSGRTDGSSSEQDLPREYDR